MGCDIHAYIEVQPVAGRAQYVGEAYLPQNYELFALMADVRNYPERGVKVPIAKPKELPVDTSPEVVQHMLRWRSDAHSSSWLAIEELEEVQSRYAVLVKEPGSWWGSPGQLVPAGSRVMAGVGCHEGLQFVAVGEAQPLGEHPKLTRVIEQMKKLTDRGTPRLVFWFDN